jgi:YggT family protein
MSILTRNFVLSIVYVLDQLLSFYSMVLFVAILITWVNPDPRNPIVRFLYSVTEPVLYQIRRRLPFVVAGGIDFSPLVVFLGIQVIRIMVVDSLRQVAYQMAALPLHLIWGA